MTPLLPLLAVSAWAQFAPPPVPHKAAVELAFPTLELFALTTPMFMASDPMPLSDKERADARELFGASLDYDAVRVVFTEYETSKAMVAGSVIRMPKKGYNRRLLMHELTHVWQFQTQGASYLSKALGEHAAKGDGAYTYALVEGKALGEYGVEQQAEIVEDYYAYPKHRANPLYQKLIAELKTRKPVYRSNLSAVEGASRLQLDPRLPPSPYAAVHPRFGELPAIMPQLELRF